ncbi:exosome component 1 [Pyrenophora tritici-repentis]|uniref:Exosome component n=2 Tax=Pyrenophora tritici-repentis TaxID=45151 RepID=A0A2W1FGH1_9PLEO|nr:exosome component 1 [Pyrenophora tritici-repentis Pt-1C-BFP]KAA8618933.1 Exosome component 1 [Pyrenophora tritici-repentis]EDU48765.1 exosome component 1 [Pyrenophora tritici-repentis Pt-1C-BFP]KAF7449415.1 Exosome component 1 [Pyrenophora tritici-repentis]KAF7570565.1 exosome component 1 [Pyrenophora tritici-repentis]KAG9383660.1 Exosome component 1 [Pyrenophora tritici-repentis]
MTLPQIALPGQFLAKTSDYLPGPGTHIHESQIYASIAGLVISTPSSSTANTTSKSSNLTPLLSITRPPSSTDPGILGPNSGAGIPLLPTVSSTVLVRITRLGSRFASCEILVIDNLVCREAFVAQIRREDIRATEKDKIKIEESFRVGDLVRGTVISLGDSGNYYVATDSNEYGVVLARSEEGRIMHPVSWKEFRDPVSGKAELRKAAKPF